MKKLYRSKKNKTLTGLIGGIGEYFAIDPTVLRLLFVLLVIFTGIFPGVIFYIIAIFVVPEQGDTNVVSEQ